MPKSFDLFIGIVTVIGGLAFLLMIPSQRRSLTMRQEKGERTADQVNRALKNLKLVAVCQFVVGGGILCKYFFDLY